MTVYLLKIDLGKKLVTLTHVISTRLNKPLPLSPASPCLTACRYFFICFYSVAVNDFLSRLPTSPFSWSSCSLTVTEAVGLKTTDPASLVVMPLLCCQEKSFLPWGLLRNGAIRERRIRITSQCNTLFACTWCPANTAQYLLLVPVSPGDDERLHGRGLSWGACLPTRGACVCVLFNLISLHLYGCSQSCDALLGVFLTGNVSGGKNHHKVETQKGAAEGMERSWKDKNLRVKRGGFQARY